MMLFVAGPAFETATSLDAKAGSVHARAQAAYWSTCIGLVELTISGRDFSSTWNCRS
jgi:hypothetical protein